MGIKFDFAEGLKGLLQYYLSQKQSKRDWQQKQLLGDMEQRQWLAQEKERRESASLREENMFERMRKYHDEVDPMMDVPIGGSQGGILGAPLFEKMRQSQAETLRREAREERLKYGDDKDAPPIGTEEWARWLIGKNPKTAAYWTQLGSTAFDDIMGISRSPRGGAGGTPGLKPRNVTIGNEKSALELLYGTLGDAEFDYMQNAPAGRAAQNQFLSLLKQGHTQPAAQDSVHSWLGFDDQTKDALMLSDEPAEGLFRAIKSAVVTKVADGRKSIPKSDLPKIQREVDKAMEDAGVLPSIDDITPEEREERARLLDSQFDPLGTNK